LFRVLLKKALCALVSCWIIYTLYYVHSIKYIMVTICGTLSKIVFYLLIPIASWFGGLLIEGMLELIWSI